MRLSYEKSILATYLYRDLLSEKDFNSIFDTKIPFELFKANRTHRMIAKSIFNLMEEDLPFDENTVIDFIEKHEPIIEQEFLNIIATVPLTFKSMKGYIKILQKIEKEDEIKRLRI